MKQVFANHSEEKEILPLTTHKIAEAQKADDKLKRNAVLDKELEVSLVEDTHLVCKDGRMIIPKPLQWHTMVPPLPAASITHWS